MDFVRGVYYAASSFLLGIIAMSMIELTQGVKSTGSPFGSYYLEDFQSIAGLISVILPVFFLIVGLIAEAKKPRQASSKTNTVPETLGQQPA